MSEEMSDEQLAQFEAALGIAEAHLEKAMDATPELADFVAVAMIEVAVNAAVDAMGHEDIVGVLRDLADQIEKDASEMEN